MKETRDEDVWIPIRNYSGEIVGWRERTDSDKLQRKRLKEEFLSPEPESDSEEESSPGTPPESPPPATVKPVKIVIQVQRRNWDFHVSRQQTQNWN